MRGSAPCLVVCVLLAAGAAAQEVRVPARLSLDEAVRLAEAHSPALVAARAAAAAAAADVVSANQRPNPTLSVDSQGLPVSQSPRPPFLDNQQLTVAIEQEIELGGRRSLRTQTAQLAADAAQASAQDRSRRLRRDVQRAYLHAALARADWEAACAALEDIDTVLSINRARYEQGELSGVELRRLQVERHHFADDERTAELALTNARTLLLSSMGMRPLSQPFDLADGLASPASAQEADASTSASALSLRPDLVAQQRRVDEAGAGAQLQHALRLPPFAIGGGYQRDFGTNAIVLRARIALPVFGRNQGGIARADAERRAADADLRAVTDEAALDVQLAMNGVEAHRVRVASLERDYLRNAREARDIVLAAYRAGAATLIDYLDAQRVLIDAQRLQNHALFEYRVSLCDLDAALGRSSTVSSRTP